MYNLKHWLLLLFASFLSHLCYSQQSYIATDSSMATGVKLLKGSARENARIIKVVDKEKLISYTPHDVAEYSFDDGRTFKAFNVDENGKTARYFLERIFKGKYNIYYLPLKNKKGTYYITATDKQPLTAIPSDKAALEEFLKEYVKDCPQATANLTFVTFTRNSLIRFFKDYKVCSNSHLPRLRYGLSMGVGTNKFTPGSTTGLLKLPGYRYNTDYFFGAFVNSPVGITDFSVVTGPEFHHYRSSVAFKERENMHDLVVSQWRLKVPVLLRYSFMKLKSPPFLELGPVYSGRLTGSSVLYSYEQTGENIFIERNETNAMARHQLGVAIGAGTILKYSSNYSLQFKAGYERLYPALEKQETLVVNEFKISLGLLF